MAIRDYEREYRFDVCEQCGTLFDFQDFNCRSGFCFKCGADILDEDVDDE